MDKTNYVLIGMSVIAASCIYLFYLNFKKMRDFDALLAEVKDLKYIQETNNQEMGKLFKLSTSNRDMLGNIL